MLIKHKPKMEKANIKSVSKSFMINVWGMYTLKAQRLKTPNPMVKVQSWKDLLTKPAILQILVEQRTSCRLYPRDGAESSFQSFSEQLPAGGFSLWLYAGAQPRPNCLSGWWAW